MVPDVDDPQFADLIETFTVPARVPLAPEIEMHLATHITPLWQATEDMLGVLDIPPPYWAFAWPGGQAITRYILDHPEMVRGKRVLDFACGGGMQAIACVMAEAGEILANDIDPVAITATRLNAKHNGVAFPTTTDNLVGTSAPGCDFCRGRLLSAGHGKRRSAMADGGSPPWHAGYSCRSRPDLCPNP